MYNNFSPLASSSAAGDMAVTIFTLERTDTGGYSAARVARRGTVSGSRCSDDGAKSRQKKKNKATCPIICCTKQDSVRFLLEGTSVS